MVVRTWGSMSSNPYASPLSAQGLCLIMRILHVWVISAPSDRFSQPSVMGSTVCPLVVQGQGSGRFSILLYWGGFLSGKLSIDVSH